jgi:4-carboxymuconolactone decarboxylase
MSEAAYYLKNETGLPSRLLEIAVLVTARQLDCQFEWTQWETDGRDPKDPRHIEESTIDLIKYDKPVAGLGEKETAIIGLGREMLGQHRVSSTTFAEVHRLFGPRLTVDLVELMAGYSACATEMRAFDQQLRDGQQPLLPAGKSHPWKPVRTSAVAPSPGPLPKDIYPDSRNRLPLPRRENMDADGKAAFDALARAGADTTSVRLYDPKLAAPSGLPDRLVAIAALVTAREKDSQYDWTQWETSSRNPKDPHHLEPAVIDLIKYDKPAAGLGERETAVINLGRAMFREEKVPSATFAEVLRLFGRRGTVDLVELMTLSSAHAAELAAFDQQLPDGQNPLLPAR